MVKQAGRMVAGLLILAAMAASSYTETGTPPRVVATYFHRTLRCQTCLHIESLARYDVTDVMASDMASGLLDWRLVNFEDEENAHFEEAFELVGPSLVITLEDGGEVVKWVRMDRVWDLHGDLEAFDKYVIGTVDGFLMMASELVAPAEEPHRPRNSP